MEDADQATGKRSKSKRATGSGIKQPSDLTPVKSRATASKQVELNSKTSKKQVTKNNFVGRNLWAASLGLTNFQFPTSILRFQLWYWIFFKFWTWGLKNP